MLVGTTLGSRHGLSSGIEFTTEAEVRRAVEVLAADRGTILDPPRPLPWSPCAVDVIDKYGVKWFISLPMLAPPECCLACVTINEKPGCDLCIRWAEEGFDCPKI